MLHLYFAAFGAVVAANIVAVIAIAATIKRDRYWPLWLAKCAEGKKPPLKMALKRPTVGLPGEVWDVPHCFA
jgi:hypothetical protein